MDKAKGHLKGAAGNAMHEPKPKGKDQAKGTVKDRVDKAAAETNEAVDKVAHSRKRTVNHDNM